MQSADNLLPTRLLAAERLPAAYRRSGLRWASNLLEVALALVVAR